jgi:hypothetical protein
LDERCGFRHLPCTDKAGRFLHIILLAPPHIDALRCGSRRLGQGLGETKFGKTVNVVPLFE